MLSSLRKPFRAAKKVFLVVFVFTFTLGLFQLFWTQKETVINHTAFADHMKAEVDKVLVMDTSSQERVLMSAVTNVYSCLTIGEGCDPDSNQSDFANSFMGSAVGFFTLPFVTPPASGIQWAANGLQNAGFVPETLAAEGLGFAAIKPINVLWKVFRDTAYVLIVLVMVTIGFLIMFRTKIDAQTVISVESALPRIVISLILITFSYAIAGFMIDLMYFLMAISVSILAGNPSDPFYNVGEMQNRMLSASPAEIASNDFLFPTWYDPESGWGKTLTALQRFAPLFPWTILEYTAKLISVSTNIILILPGIIQLFIYALSAVGTVAVLNRFLSITDYVAKIINNAGFLGTTPGFLVNGIANIAVFIVTFIACAILITPLIIGFLILSTIFLLFIRVFILVLTSYLKILLLIIFAPLYLLLDAIPGQNAFSNWIRSLFAELMTFPIISTILVLGHVMTNNVFSTSDGANSVTAPLTETFWSPPFLYGLNQSAYAFLIGTGLILIIPEIVQWFKKLVGAPSLPFSVGLGTFFQGGTTVVSGTQSLIPTIESLNDIFRGEKPLIRKAVES